MTKKYILSVLIMLITSSALHAQVSLPGYFTDGMVLQRDAPLTIWGWAGKGESVTVALNGKTAKTRAGRDGSWEVQLPSQPYGGPYTLTVRGKTNEIQINDLLLGDVWLCSGQSNMEWTVQQSANAEKEIAEANYPRIRSLRVPKGIKAVEQNDFKASWQVCSPQTAGSFSGVAYYYARELHRELQIPIGFINASWGGTDIEAWTSRDAYSVLPASVRKEYDPHAIETRGKDLNPNMVQGSLYNCMINPLTKFRIKGVVWYQGENNVTAAFNYRTLFPNMMENWRSKWGYEFPFYWVQLANLYPEDEKPSESTWAELREAQTMALALPRTGQAVVYDIGNPYDIHPTNKQDVGARLARIAFHNDYGKTDVVYSGPTFKSAEVSGNKIIVTMETHGSELVVRNKYGYLEGFAIAGVNGNFAWAQARIEGNKVILHADGVDKPVAVRYAWAHNPAANLFNKEGLPAVPFRTDTRKGITEPGRRNAHTGYEEKADSIIALMTLDEKIGQLNQITGFKAATGPVTDPGDKRRLIKEGRVGSMLNVRGHADTRAMQELAMQSRLGIPLLFGLDVIHGYRTVFPIPLGMASGFDPGAVKLASRVAARESAVSGIHWTFSPMLDVSRDPRWGRVMEGPGEDTHWASVMARAMIEGYQQPFEDGLSVMACAKHFAAYGAAIGGRDYNTVDISLQTLHNVYLPPFKAAAGSGVASFMCSFNEINGVPSSGNKYLYDLLYDEWKYDGLVVSDWASVWEMVVHGYSKDREMAAMQAINAGVTIDMESNAFSRHLKKLVEDGKVSETTLDNAVHKVLIQKYKLGLFDDPYRYCNSEKETKEVFSPENRNAAREVARKSIILLKNESNLLPAKIPETIAVIGPLADYQRAMDGNWAVEFDNSLSVTLLNALQTRYPGSRITFAKGCSITGEDKSGFAEAVDAATNADLVILALGEEWGMSGEARSRGDIHLPGVQEELACEIYKANPRTITLLMAGRPMIFNEISARAPAILYTWFLGSEAGNAILDVITGAYNPSARVPMSFPKHLGQIPVYYNQNNSGRPATDGATHYHNRYIDIDHKPQYPFAYGLSYTTFDYKDIQIGHDAGKISVKLTLTNTGHCAGSELIQVYVRKLWGETIRPVKELKAFENVFLEQGESRQIELLIPYENLKYYGQDGWEDGKGEYKVFLGRNAEELFFEGKFVY